MSRGGAERRHDAHRRRDLAECPNCGADVPAGARACRECGSDADTGWKSAEEIDYQSTELPSGYSEDPEHPGAATSSRPPRWLVVTALVLAVVFTAWAVLR